MTCIVWDGRTLAADKRACAAYVYSVTKIARIQECLVGVAGRGDKIAEFQRWFAAGQPRDTFPERDDEQHFFTALVVRHDGAILRYEGSPTPIVVEDSQHAIGSGGPLAMVAMHLGRDAVRAVEIACLFDENCGNGIDAITFDDEDGVESGHPDRTRTGTR